jgi:hypothetical protein
MRHRLVERGDDRGGRHGRSLGHESELELAPDHGGVAE